MSDSIQVPKYYPHIAGRIFVAMPQSIPLCFFFTKNSNSKNKNLCASSQNFVWGQNWEKIIENAPDFQVDLPYTVDIKILKEFQMK